MKSFKYIALTAAVILTLTAIYNFYSKKGLIADSEARRVQPAPENAALSNPPAPTDAVGKEQIAENYARLPINFEPNVGQTDERVKFLARGKGYTLFLTETEVVLSLKKNRENERAVVRMRMDGAHAAPAVGGLNETAGKTNYFIGNDPEKWRTEVPNYARVKYSGVYEGVDAVFYGNGQQLEYDFIVAPGADPQQIKLKFDGVKTAKIDKSSGDLLLETDGGTLRQHAPVVYQSTDGERRPVAASYKLAADGKNRGKGGVAVSFAIADYDESKPLVIDPILAYGTYLGGNMFDDARAVAVDAEGNAFVVGNTASRDFPTTAGTVKPQNLPSNNNQYWNDAFVTKMNPTGTALIYSTYFGGRSHSETGSGVAVDTQGNVLLTGTTLSSDLPTVNAYQPVYGGSDEAFAAKLNATGSAIIYSTYLGGAGMDIGGRIALNPANGEAVFSGATYSPDFPTTPGVIKEKLCNSPQTCSGIFYSGSYVVKLAANGSALFSTLFNAGVNDVALDPVGNIVVGGTAAINFPTTPGAFQPASSGGIDGMIAKINPTGSAVLYATFLGGGLQSDRVKAVAVDASGNIYAAGQTENAGFPTTAGAFDRTFNGLEDGFLTKLNPTGSALVYSTFFGSGGKDQPFDIALATDDSAFVVGETTFGAGFPLRNSINGTSGNIFLTRFNPTGSGLVFSTLLGFGGGYGVAADAANNAYVTGAALHVPVTVGAFQTAKATPNDNSTKDAFVMKIAPTDENAPVYSISGTITDPTQSGYYTPVTVTVTGTVNLSYTIPYGSGNGVIPYYFGNLPAGGNYTVRVRKTGYGVEPESMTFNNLGANQFADFAILNNQKPEGVITAPAHGTTYSLPATINIQATASDPDGHAIQKVNFVAYNSDYGAVEIGTDTSAPYEITWQNAPQGTWSLYAIPTDQLGLRGESTPVVHVFVVDATGLSVSISNPTEGQIFTQGDYVPLSAVVSSSVSVLEFYDQNNNLVGRRTSAPWSTTWRIMDTGSYTVTARVYNSQGDFLNSEPVNFTVGAMNHRITGRVIDLTANAGVPNITLNLTSPSNPSVSASATTDAEGRYVFANLGASVNDSVKITPVSPDYTFEPQTRTINYLGYINWETENFWATRITQINVALTSPTAGQIFTAPATINLAANASSGAGSITKVQFYQRRGAVVTLVGEDTTAPYEGQATNVAANSYAYFARATDSTGATTDSAEVPVTVNPAVSNIRLQGDITNPSGGPMQGITVRLTGTVNGNPVNQTSISNNFGAYGFFNLPAGGDYTITPQGAGGMTFTPPSFSVTNATADNYDIDFVSSAINQPPTVQINSPAAGAVYTIPTAIQFNVTSSDPDGTVTHLTVSAQSPTRVYTVGQTNNGTFNAPWQPTEPGVYTIWATARDNGGFQVSTSLNITINPPAPVSISGRIVNRDSQPLAGVTLELSDYPGDPDNPVPPAATVTTDANGGYTIANVATFSSYVLKPSSLDYTFSPAQRLFLNLAASQVNADFTGTLQVPRSDFDGDGMSDIAVWRPSDGVWHVERSMDNSYGALQFGGAAYGDVAVPGNYDGDKQTDYAVYRSGVWYIRQSSNAVVLVKQFGLAEDKPAAGDYDGDGKTDLAVWRPSNGVWYIWRSSDGGYDYRQFGLDGDLPLSGDYDGDGKADITIWRPSNGVWYVQQSSDGGYRSYQFGLNGDVPLVGDFDGDKRADYTIFRPSTGVWYVNLSSNNDFKIIQWGVATDIPVPADFDRDGRTDFGVFRPSEGNWYVFKSSTNTYIVRHFGANGDMPIPAAYR